MRELGLEPDNYKTPLIKDAIRMAARNIDLPEGAIFHSDGRSNYASDEFAKELKELKMRQSVGHTRDHGDVQSRFRRLVRRAQLEGASASALGVSIHGGCELVSADGGQWR